MNRLHRPVVKNRTRILAAERFRRLLAEQVDHSMVRPTEHRTSPGCSMCVGRDQMCVARLEDLLGEPLHFRPKGPFQARAGYLKIHARIYELFDK